jgi:hypothetical protein
MIEGFMIYDYGNVMYLTLALQFFTNAQVI